KAPMAYVEKHFSDMMEQDVLKTLVNDTYFKTIQDEKLFPVAYPEIESDQLKRGEPFKYSATIEIYPEVKIEEYAGLELVKEQFVKNDEIVEQRLGEMRENMAQLKPAEDGHPSANGDFLTLDFKGFIDGAPFENGAAEDYHLELGSSRFIPGFEEQLVGLKAGDEKEITVTFPAEYHGKELAGKEATFHVKIKEIKIKELPSLDDDFAKEVGEFETLAQLRDKIAEGYERQEKERIESDLRDRTVKVVIEKNPLEVPTALVEKQLQIMLDGTKKRLSLEKLSLDMIGLDDEAYRGRFRDTAETQVKGALLLDALAAQEKITAEDGDLNDHIRELARERGQDAAKLEQFYEQNENARESLRDFLRERKIFAFIWERAKISEVPRSELEKKPEGE
ncbi:MAG TPA: trigger factor, partial [Geobacteraceae bacterium]